MNYGEMDGVLLIDKPSGCTSHDVVDRVRRKLSMRRIGHAGTLDPMATGLLIMLVGKSTKLSQYLISLSKVYVATLKLGETTDTQDQDGEIIESKVVPDLSEKEIYDCGRSFMGDQYQKPPMFSAKKIKGVPLYKLARKGKEVEREDRFIHISRFDITRIELPLVDFTLHCSKGTYVRTVAHDFGQKIGCGAHLKSLRRIASDKFHVDSALTLEQFERASIEEIGNCLIPSYHAVPSFVS